MKIDQEILQQAIEKWGIDAQWGMVEEECMELAIEIHKAQNRGLNGSRWDKIIDELADVNIMVAQANIMVDNDQLQSRIDYKLNRLKGRLEKSEF